MSLYSCTSNQSGNADELNYELIITNASGGSDPISVPQSSPSLPSVFLTHFEALGILIMQTPTTSLSNISMLMSVSYTALIKDCYCNTV